MEIREKKEINSIEEVDRILDQIRSMTVISHEKSNVQGYSYFWHYIEMKISCKVYM